MPKLKLFQGAAAPVCLLDGMSAEEVRRPLTTATAILLSNGLPASPVADSITESVLS